MRNFKGVCMNYGFKFTYKVHNKIKTADGANEDFDLDVKTDKHHLKVTLCPKTAIEILSFYVQTHYDFGGDTKFMANGYQSWTDTKEFTKYERMPGAGLVAKSPFGKAFGLKYVGDYNFVNSETDDGCFHSHGFAYVAENGKINLFGSLSDKTGYTVIYADMNKDFIRFSKDVEGVVFASPYDILDLYIDSGDYDAVFDRYFDAMGVKPLTDEKLKGYTSWYNYYQNISQDIVLRDLESLSTQKEYVNIFQIDDGYQTAVGDWLSIDGKKFPSGMKHIADSIHAKGLNAGIWLAPFGAQKKSKLATEHPDWLIKDKKGKPIPVGANWGGFYALDIYNDGARDYIKNVFDTVLNKWGFDLVKLDFLYAACIVPLYGKSRGEIEYDAIEFLRECVGDKKILGCGVPMMPCFGKVDYMRIGADMALSWKHTLLRKNMHREDVSTPNAVHNSIYRRCLNGRAFLNDPDVFLLRRNNIGFTVEQQNLLAKFIKLFGSVLFMSDNVADYDGAQLSVFKDVMTDDAKILAINEVNDIVFIDYSQNNKEHTLKFNVATGDIY